MGLAPKRKDTKVYCKAHMFSIYDQCIDECLELNYTKMVELTCDEVDKMEWLDDKEHWIWDLPFEVEDNVARSVIRMNGK